MDGGPRTIVFPGETTQVLTGPLPQLGRFVVESVVATIDNSGGPDTTPELTVADPTGEVIATKAQTSLIPAGGSGTATWALRLTDDGGAKGVGKWGWYRGNVNSTVPGSDNFVFQGNLAAGQEMFSYGNGADSPSPLVDGLYSISAKLDASLAPVPPAPDYFMVQLIKFPAPVFSSGNQSQRESAPFVTLPFASAEPTWPLITTDFFNLQVWQNAAVPLVWGFTVLVALIEGIP